MNNLRSKTSFLRVALNLPPGVVKQWIHGTKPVSQMMETKGQIALKHPAKVLCEEGKTYSWCACGHSKKQPFCDGSHSRTPGGFKPLRWTSTSTKEYFFCQCKQTNAKPLCDGTHKKL